MKNDVKRLARDHHSGALAQLASRLAVVVKYGSRDGANPFGKVNLVISPRSLECSQIGGWGVTPTGKSFRFVRACERARRSCVGEREAFRFRC